MREKERGVKRDRLRRGLRKREKKTENGRKTTTEMLKGPNAQHHKNIQNPNGMCRLNMEGMKKKLTMCGIAIIAS